MPSLGIHGFPQGVSNRLARPPTFEVFLRVHGLAKFGFRPVPLAQARRLGDGAGIRVSRNTHIVGPGGVLLRHSRCTSESVRVC